MASIRVTESAADVMDRPVFVLAAPRSGSTLLFEVLSQAKGFWTIGGESHDIFEGIPAFRPMSGHVDSNRLSAEDANPVVRSQLIHSFLVHLRNCDSVPLSMRRPLRVRMLEKTPKNALRLSFLNALFPDALFIYLYRDARDNVSSIIDAWRSSRFITYRELPNWVGPWSLLLPPGWQAMRGQPLEQIAAFQWEAANRFILDDLIGIPPDRWTCVNYADLVHDSKREIRRLCVFSGVSFDKRIKKHVSDELPMSRYTLTKPAPDKWKNNEKEVCAVLPSLDALSQRIQTAASGKRLQEKSTGNTPPRPTTPSSRTETQRRLGRNELCYCGSGRKYKHCHG